MSEQKETHYPTRNGPVCGRDRHRGRGSIPTPTDARDYSLSPTCEDCQRYVAGIQRMAPNPSRADAPAAPTEPPPDDDEDPGDPPGEPMTNPARRPAPAARRR